MLKTTICFKFRYFSTKMWNGSGATATAVKSAAKKLKLSRDSPWCSTRETPSASSYGTLAEDGVYEPDPSKNSHKMCYKLFPDAIVVLCVFQKHAS